MLAPGWPSPGRGQHRAGVQVGSGALRRVAMEVAREVDFLTSSSGNWLAPGVEGVAWGNDTGRRMQIRLRRFCNRRSCTSAGTVAAGFFWASEDKGNCWSCLIAGYVTQDNAGQLLAHQSAQQPR